MTTDGWTDLLTHRLKCTPAGRTILNRCFTDTDKSIDGYILEQSVSVMAIKNNCR